MAYQKFITKEILKKIPNLYVQEKKGDNAVVYAKWFTPWSYWTWFATELDPETNLAFGLIVTFETELGYFDLNEMQELVGPGGVKIERDQWFTPKTLREVKESLK